MFKKDRLT